MADESLNIPDDMREFVDDFLVEADDLIESLDNDLVTLESSPDDLALLDNIFRAAHTIKGNSSFLALDQVTALTHKMEDVLNRLRKGDLKVTTHIMDVLLESIDKLKELLEDVRLGKLVKRDLTLIEKRLIEINEAESSDALGSGKKSKSKAKAVSATKKAAGKSKKKSKKAATENSSEDEMSLEEYIASQGITIGSGNASSAEKTEDVSTSGSDKAVAAIRTEHTVRVGVDRLDSLMNLVGELVLGRNSLLQMNSDISGTEVTHEIQERVTSITSQISFVTTELQNSVMKLRMLPIGKVFNKYPRLVRDLASNAGKKIDLEMFGQETELDKTVIEEIGDPLVHLIRNSCDHGIESPEERIANGKPEHGKVTLTAAQQGSNILVSIEDDGRGLDIEAIKRKAIERNLTTETELERLSRQDIFNFIFSAGFSTAKVVSDVSGRGVGMDVVRTNVERINGMIDLVSEPGKGTKVTIKLPLTLAIIQGLLVSAGEDIFIIPLASVLETVKVEDSDVSYVNGVKVIRLRESVLPILPLQEVMRHGNSWSPKDYGRSNVVVVGLADKRMGLIVDKLLGQEEVVIKSLGRLFGNIQGLAGATILGDGRIRLIVDVAGLFSLASSRAAVA